MSVVDLLVWVVMLAVSAAGGWVLTGGLLRLASRSPDSGGAAVAVGVPAGLPVGGTATTPPDPVSAVGAAGPDGEGARAALRGGTWIGLLERIAVTGCLLAGQPEGIAIVVAVKGLGRYPELREHPEASERFVIGTLASLLWACLVGAVGRLVLA